MKNKIRIIGHVGQGLHIINELKEKGIDVVVVDNKEAVVDNSFILNDVRYGPIGIEVEKMKSTNYLPYAQNFGINEPYVRELPKGTDIIKEYGLIQNRQSKLSKWGRDTVVRIFEKNYRVLD